MGNWELEDDIVEGGCINCSVCVAISDFVVRLSNDVDQIGGFIHEKKHDLAMVVSDFLENGSVGAESWCRNNSNFLISLSSPRKF